MYDPNRFLEARHHRCTGFNLQRYDSKSYGGFSFLKGATNGYLSILIAYFKSLSFFTEYVGILKRMSQIKIFVRI